MFKKRKSDDAVMQRGEVEMYSDARHKRSYEEIIDDGGWGNRRT